jgi:hypothetical protein
MQNQTTEVEDHTQDSEERTVEMNQNPATGVEGTHTTGDGTDVPPTYKVSSRPESLKGEAAVGEGINPEDED